MKHMYVRFGFRLAANGVVVNGSGVELHLTPDKERSCRPRFVFPDGCVDGLLVDLEEGNERPLEAEVLRLLTGRAEHYLQIAPVGYRQLFVPLRLFREAQPYVIRRLGGVCVPP
jgi:hypothetical protein